MRDRPLRIGVVAPPWVPVPPAAYGGTELMLDALCTALRRAGHRVILFTTGDSTCPVTRRWVYDSVDPDRMGASVIELRHTAAAYDALRDVDVVHDHTYAGLFLSELMPWLPVVTTLHGRFDDDMIDLYGRVDDRIQIVAISHDQAARAPAGLRIAGVIHHGLLVERYPFASLPRGDEVVCLGRMSPDKGVDTAIAAARQAEVPLRIAAKMREPAERRYFEEVIEPQLGDGIEYVGEVGFEQKVALLRDARALLNPIRWPEPFGLVMIEALGCGTPVVGYRCGAAAELIDPGRTGYLVDPSDDGVGGLVAGLRRVGELDRRGCRRDVERRFTAERMASEYVEVYRSAIAANRRGWPARAVS